MRQKNTQLIIPNSNLKESKIETKYSNRKNGPLVIETPSLFCFGVTERKKSRNRPINRLFNSSLPLEKRRKS